VLLAGPVFTYTKHEKVVDLGPVEVTAANRKHVSLPPVLGGAALVVGVVLLVTGTRRERS
jgi:di/tricarboxylate transporter